MSWRKETKNAHTPSQAKNLLVQARAGTGKTFSMIEGLNRAQNNPTRWIVGSPQQEAIWDQMTNLKYATVTMVAFNKSIATELQRKIPAEMTASTFHSMCFGVIRKAFGKVRVYQYKVSDILTDLIGPWKREDATLRNGIERLVGLSKNCLTTDLPFLTNRYSVELNGDENKAYQLIPEVIERSANKTDVIDFNDMCWFVYRHNLKIKKSDQLIVDEAQDLTKLQQHICTLAGDRLIAVGDYYQSIYGFAGADTESLFRMKECFGQTDRGVMELPLTVSRRCPKSHVELAKKLVPDFEAMSDAIDGEIWNRNEEEVVKLAAPGDFFLCRTNAPLIKWAFRFVRSGQKAVIQGRDFGKSLTNFIKNLQTSPAYSQAGVKGDIDRLLISLGSYKDTELDRIAKSKYPSAAKAERITDRTECIECLCEGMNSISDVTKAIESIFGDFDQEGKPKKAITLSSVHRAKGLEAERVFVLKPELMPHPMAKVDWEREQERNIEYVALTRSKNILAYINEKN